MPISERIKMYRKQAHMTQKQLAEKANLAEITIRQYEGGLYEPKSESAGRIAEALGISIAELMGWDEQINIAQIAQESRFLKVAAEVGGLVCDLNEAFSRLNTTGQQKAVEYVKDLAQIDTYARPENE